MVGKDAPKKVATEFEKIINEARDRKKNEELAARIFNKDRHPSTPSNGSSANTGSLASRAGVKKQRAAPPNKPRHSTGNIDSEWVHDLHRSTQDPRPGSLASRISNPNLGPSAYRAPRKAKQLAQALIRTELNEQRPSPLITGQASSGKPTRATPPTGPRAASQNQGLTIRGLAGPFVCLAHNFAPGTTAADIESAMTPVSGVINRVRIVKTDPIVIAEITFQNKDGAEEAIKAFNNQTADGRVLKVYAKPGNQETPDSQISGFHPPSGPRAMRNDMVIDGTMGFDDPMETDGYSNGNGRQPPKGPAADASGLYSDDVMRTSRRGRGFDRNGGY